MKSQYKLAAALSAVISANPASAVVLDFGQNFYINDGINTSDSFTELGYLGSANSIYDISGGTSSTTLDVGDKVWDVSAGTIQSFTNQLVDPAEAVLPTNYNPSNSNPGSGWQINYAYEFSGTTAAVTPTPAGPKPLGLNFQGGYFDLYFNDKTAGNTYGVGNDNVKLLRVVLSSFSVDFSSNASIFINGKVDFTGMNPSQFVKDFFVFTDTNTSFYDTWLAGGGIDLPIAFQLDTNLAESSVPTNPLALTILGLTVPTLSGVPTGLYAGNVSNWGNSDQDDLLGRRTTTNVGIRFQVPEPSMLGLMGLGLALLGLNTRSKKFSA